MEESGDVSAGWSFVTPNVDKELAASSVATDTTVYIGSEDIARQIWRVLVEEAADDEIFQRISDDPVRLPADWAERLKRLAQHFARDAAS